MKQMKNFLALALAALMILSLTACSGLTDKATELQMTALVQGNIDELYLVSLTPTISSLSTPPKRKPRPFTRRVWPPRPSISLITSASSS